MAKQGTQGLAGIGERGATGRDMVFMAFTPFQREPQPRLPKKCEIDGDLPEPCNLDPKLLWKQVGTVLQKADRPLTGTHKIYN